MSIVFLVVFEFVFRSVSMHFVLSTLTCDCTHEMDNEYIKPVYVQDLHNHQEGEVRNSHTDTIILWYVAHRFFWIPHTLPYGV